MLSREMVMRINQMITKEKVLWSLISRLISKEIYEYQSGEFVCGYWGLKGLIHDHGVRLERLTAQMEVVGFYS